MTRQRVCPGRDVRVLDERDDGVELEGPMRLRPGSTIEIVSDGRAEIRPAVVWSWTLVRTGRQGPTYRGFCRWT